MEKSVLEENKFRIHAQYHFDKDLKNIELVSDENATDVVRQSFLQGKRTYLNNTKDKVIYTPQKDMPINSLCALPLIAEVRNKFGILVIECNKRGVFSESIEDVLHGIAHVITCMVAHRKKEICPRGAIWTDIPIYPSARSPLPPPTI